MDTILSLASLSLYVLPKIVVFPPWSLSLPTTYHTSHSSLLQFHISPPIGCRNPRAPLQKLLGAIIFIDDQLNESQALVLLRLDNGFDKLPLRLASCSEGLAIVGIEGLDQFLVVPILDDIVNVVVNLHLRV